MPAPPSRPAIEHLVFDVGQVLLHWDPDLAYRQLIPDADSRTWFLREVCGPAWNLEQDRGRPWRDGELEATARHPACAELIRAYRARWHRMVPHAFEHTVALMREQIAAGVDVTLLSNFAADTFAESAARFPFLAQVRGRTVSGEVAMVKPEPPIYRLHAARHALRAERILFIDDRADNVAAARAEGWHAHRHTDAEALRRALSRHDIRPRAA